MKNQERYRTVPHVDLIVKDGDITIPSIFTFGKDTSGLFLFISCCRDMNCTLHFKNENLHFNPTEYDSGTNMKLSCYMGIMAQPKFAEDYIKYLFNKDDMSWDKINN